MTKTPLKKGKKICELYNEFQGSGIFAPIYQRLRENGVDGEICILIGVKDGEVYGKAQFFNNPEPVAKGKVKSIHDSLHLTIYSFMHSLKIIRGNYKKVLNFLTTL